LFRNRYIRTIILSNVLLQLGIWIRNFAILLYVTDITNNDPRSVSLIAVVEYVPIFLFAVIGGTFADRWRPKLTMVWSDILSAISVLIVLLVLIYGSWHALFFATFVSAMLSQFSQPSAMKLFKQHVPAEQLQSVMALFQSLMAIFMVIGPVIGVFIYQRYGIEVSLSAMVVAFLASALVLTTLPRDPQADKGKAAKRSFTQDMTDGLRFVWSNRVLRTLGGTFTVAGLAVGFIQPLMLFVSMENLGQSKDFMQWLLMANGAAMFVGGGMIMGIAKKVKPQKLLALGLIVSTLGTIGVGWSENIALTMLFQVLNGLFYPCIHIGINTIIMQNTEVAYVGRVSGVMTPLFMGFMVIGMSAAGYLKEMFSLMAVFSASGILFLIGALLLVPLFGYNRIADQPAPPAQPVQPADHAG